MNEMLAFGKKYPYLQRKFPIVALGSVAFLYGDRHVGYLSSSDFKRVADLRCFDGGWFGDYRFLGVRDYDL